MIEWTDTVDAQDIPEGGVIEYVLDGEILALANYRQRVYVVEGICPHQGGSLGRGTLHASQPCLLRCPWHGWEYELNTGQHVSIPAVSIGTYESRIIDGVVQVRRQA